MVSSSKNNKYAVWAVTPNGSVLAKIIENGLKNVDRYLSTRLADENDLCFRFKRLKEKVTSVFNQYKGHIFIMSAGIVVRIIAPVIIHKTIDPAVVVVDDKGKHAISLLSGHLGRANRLAEDVAKVIGASPIITTATDTNNLPSLDLIAQEMGFFIENPENIKKVNLALLEEKVIQVIDPYGFFKQFPANNRFELIKDVQRAVTNSGIYIGDEIKNLPSHFLLLRPSTLVAGVGCNRGTNMEEIRDFLYHVFIRFNLSLKSLCRLASIDIKRDEAGLIQLADCLNLPIDFFSSHELEEVYDLQTPSELVKKHIGVKGVCEAAALLAAKTKTLLVPKQITKNVAVAVARIAYI